jgi:hypothetical protein
MAKLSKGWTGSLAKERSVGDAALVGGFWPFVPIRTTS